MNRYLIINNQNQIQMKNLNSLFIAGFCVSLSFVSFSQNETDDTNSDCARWTLVKNSEDNAALFAALPEIFEEIKRQNDLGLLYSTRETAEVGPLIDNEGQPIVQTSENGEQMFVYQDKTITTVQSDVPLVDDDGENIILTLEDGTQMFVFEEPLMTSSSTDVPLTDENGKPIVQTLDDGTSTFIYPNRVNFKIQPQSHAIDENGGLVPYRIGEPMNYSISELAISELHIVQSRKSYDRSTGEFSDDFHVSRIAICMNISASSQERIWIDLLSFFENMENLGENAFYMLLTEGNYEGYQYKQHPCK